MNKIKEKLDILNPSFTEKLGEFIEKRIMEINEKHSLPKEELFSERQIMLITYADQFRKAGEAPLKTLNTFMKEDLKGLVSLVHLLPFYPWTSDDGFSPVTYDEVESSYGAWKDIEQIKFPMMFDCVFNHMSASNTFFKKALAGDKDSEAMFHVFEKNEYEKEEFQEDIQKVVRPRVSPLFTPYQFPEGEKYVWTTFSADQIDTNLSNPDMLKYILDSFFLYIEKGARYFRVDAVPFLWKELGTNCSHLPKTHEVVKLFRAIVEEIELPLYIVTESNVPHNENITYFGEGDDEAHVVYNFSLSPLILHALKRKTNKFIHNWGTEVFDISNETTFLNFTASHDGIGMRGLEGIVPEEDIQALCQQALDHGGQVGKKTSRDGTTRPYELNITWASMMKESGLSEEDFVRKVSGSQSLVLFFPGIGAHYVHNFLGSLNDQEGFKESGIARRLNRKKNSYPVNYSDISLKIRDELLKWVETRISSRAFHPKGEIEFLNLDEEVISFKRSYKGDEKKVFFNLTNQKKAVDGTDLLPFELKII